MLARDGPIYAKKGMTMTAPLHFAATTNDLESLDNKMVNTPDDPYNPDPVYGELQETPLMLACYSGALDAVKKISTFPCDIYKENKNKENCLHYACQQGRAEVVMYLCNFVRQEPLKTYYEKRRIAANAASRKKRREEQLDAGIAEIDLVLSDEEVDPDWTEEDSDKAEDLLVNQRSNSGMSPLMWASKKGSLEIVKYFLDRGAETKFTNDDGETALTLAIQKRYTEVGMALIDGGSDKDHVNKKGWTPLMIASGNGDLKTVSSLVKRLCRVNYFTTKLATALVIAKARGCDEVVQILVDGGAESDIEKIKEDLKAEEARLELERLNKTSDRPQTSEERRRNQAKIKVL